MEENDLLSNLYEEVCVGSGRGPSLHVKVRGVALFGTLCETSHNASFRAPDYGFRLWGKRFLGLPTLSGTIHPTLNLILQIDGLSGEITQRGRNAAPLTVLNST